MSTVNQDELKAIKVLKFTGKESEWDHRSEKYVTLARARGFVILTKRNQMAAMN